MAAILLRRSFATAGLAALATLASPLITTASAAAPALSAPTFSPADGATVAATQPPISAVYNTALNPATTTIAVTDTSDSDSPVSCSPAFSADATTISCTLGSGLTDGHVYKVAVHAENADSSSTRDDSASWTVDIPSVLSTSPIEGAVLGSAQVAKAVFDEQIDTTHSTAKLVNGNGNRVPASVSISNPSPTGQPTVKHGTITITSAVSLPANTYTATFHADGVDTSNPVSAADNPAAYADVVIHFTVDKVMPPAGPANVVAPPYINADNVKAVPFSGYAPPGFPVGVAIYDEDCDQNCNFPDTDTEGFGLFDGFNSVTVPTCSDSDAISPNGVRLCPWSLTVDDSAGCDTGTPEFQCGNADAGSAVTQWYAYSFSGAGQVPAAADPAHDPEIMRDTSPPGAPDSAQGHVSGSTVTVNGFTNDSDTDDVVVKVTDPVGNSVSQTFNLVSQPAGAPTFGGTIDASSLADGTLTVTAFGRDAAQNVGSGTNAQPDSLTASFSKETVTTALADPVTPDTLVVNGQTRHFDDLTATDHIGMPTKITVYFNEPIRLGVTQTSGTPPTTTPLYTSEICIRESDTLCVNRGVGTYKTVDHDYALEWTAPADFKPSDAGSPYTITAFGVAATCQNKTPANATGYTCERSAAGPETGSATQTLTSFTLDTEPPTVGIGHVDSPITNANAATALMSGTASSDATEIQVLIKSSGGGGSQLASTTPFTDGCAAPAPQQCWTLEFAGALVGVPDGTLSLTAFAIDAGDNKSTAATGRTVLDMLHLRASPGDGRATLTWVKPTNGGAGHPITGFTLSAVDTSTNTALATRELLPTATSATVTKLTNGHAYTFRLVAHDESGNGPTAIRTATPRSAMKLTETTSAKTANYHQLVKLSGRLTRVSDGKGFRNTALTIRPHYDNHTVGKAITVKTGNFGLWSYSLRVVRNATYYVSYAGSATMAPAASHAARTLVRAAIAFTSPRNRSRVASPVLLKGKVSPNKKGRTIKIYRHTSSGNHLVGQARLSSTSTWTFKLRLPHGTFKLVAVIGRTVGNLGNRSRYLEITH
ncbi:MAG TPA: fibronectin type III domain-containing protein [Mycobacteriales bacterium]|nr:fibronectin type III domain-containing protein [Mycobacteriales bacterium]